MQHIQIELKPHLEIIEVAGEYMAVPISDSNETFKGILALTSASSYLLKQMDSPKTKDELIQLLCERFEIDPITAEKDIDGFIVVLKNHNLIKIIETDNS